MKQQPISKILLPITIMVLIALSCDFPSLPSLPSFSATDTPPSQPEVTGPTEPVITAEAKKLSPEKVYLPAFAEYPDVQVRLPESFEGDYSLPIDLDDVAGMEFIELSSGQQTLLSNNGFVVAAPVPGKYREFYQIYESMRYNYDQLAFITTDAVFHVYHLLFDKILRDLERETFIPDLEILTSAMLQASLDQYQSLKGTPLEEPARRNVAYFSVEAQLLGLPDPVPADVSDLVSAELELINNHLSPDVSPIWDRPGQVEDERLVEEYTQYIPRGHYTRSEAFERYFRSMMWLGRMTFRLREPFETQRAILIVDALRKAAPSTGESAEQLWENLYEPIGFIVGKADDPSCYEYGVIMDAVFGPDPDPLSFADQALLDQFIASAAELPPPQVNSMWVWIWEDKEDATRGFRFMGQRFTLDAYVFGQVMWRNVGTITDPRDLPKALDFFSAMGSEEALSILQDMGEPDYANYSKQMNKVTSELAALEQDSWTQNLYWSWLYSFHPLITAKDARYPVFMQTQAWTRKDLHTALGSWTELKHDTILYAKQVMAELGGGGPEEIPQGYVEPNPEVYARLYALTKMTSDGLTARDAIDPNIQGNLENLMDLLSFLQRIAEQELNDEPISEDDYWRIQFVGGELEALTIAAADKDDEFGRDLSDQKAALVADVATGIGRVLEEAIGQPTPIYVVLPDQPWRIGIGAVFTYYEFIVPPEQRMTDEEWQAMVESGDTPPAPDWTSSFMAP